MLLISGVRSSRAGPPTRRDVTLQTAALRDDIKLVLINNVQAITVAMDQHAEKALGIATVF